MKGLSRKIGQLLLEGAKGDGALVEVLRALRCLQADAVFHKVINTPIAVFPLVIPALPCFCINQVQGSSRGTVLPAQVRRYRSDVLLKASHVRKGTVADFLEDIPPPGFCDHLVGFVDMTAAVTLAAGRRCIQRELRKNFSVQCFHFRPPPVIP